MYLARFCHGEIMTQTMGSSEQRVFFTYTNEQGLVVQPFS